jgi:PAS domain S-box-containing protein
MVFWDDPEMALDYSLVRKEYMDGKVENIKILNESVISGYFVLNDVYGKPQAIIRTDIDRDVYFQGQRGIYLLVGILALLSVIAGGINYYLVTISVLGKVTKIIEDVDYLAKTGNIKERLDLGSGKDEVDNLRLKINNMLYSLDNSQRQLVTEKMKSESFIDLIDAIVVSLDVHGIVEDMNQKGAEILGYKKEEVIGMNWLESFIPAESKDKVKGIFNDIVGGDLINNAHVDNEVLCKNGEKLMISWHNTYVKGVDGAISGTVSIGEDITDESIEQAKRVEYAKELERLNQLMVGRELKMIEMKKEIEELKKNDGKK